MPVIHDTFTLHRSFPHSRERVFSALSDPALKDRWYADATMETQISELDFRVGGIERQRYVLREGSPFPGLVLENEGRFEDRKSTRLNSSHVKISYAVFCLKKKKKIKK